MRKLLLLAVLFLFALRSTFAQEILQLGQLTSGELTVETPTASYFVAVESGKALRLQAVTATPGLTVQATLNTAAGTLIQSIPNLNNSPALEADLTPEVDGILRLDISSASGTTGKFVLLLQEITPPEPDAELSMNQPTTGTLQPDATIVYALTGDPESRLILRVTATDPLTSLEVELLSAGGAIIASLETQAGGSDLLIPAQRADFQVRLDNAGQAAVGYEITLQALDRLISTPVPSLTIAPTIPVTLAATEPLFCTVTPLNIAVNIRRGPSTQFAAFATLQPGAAMIAVARNPEGTWYQVDTGAGLGWVALSVAAALGPCGSLQVVYIPTPTFPPVTNTQPPGTEVPPVSTSIPNLDAACFNKYAGAVYVANIGACFTCPDPYYVTQSSQSARCQGNATVRASQHSPATGLLHTDCPAGSGQFWDPDGYCYSCPIGYDRGVAPVTSREACVRNSSPAPSLIFVGYP